MDSVGYAGLTYYCLRSVFDEDHERDGDRLLGELRSDPQFASQAWTKDEFSTIWYWVQKALAQFPLWGDRQEDASFSFDVRTSVGRLIKHNMSAADAVVCGKAHVRLKQMEAAEASITEEVRFMKNTCPGYWREVFSDRRRYCGAQSDEAGVLFERPKERVCGKTPPDNCCRRVEVLSFDRDETGKRRMGLREVVDNFEDRARWATAKANQAAKAARREAEKGEAARREWEKTLARLHQHQQ